MSGDRVRPSRIRAEQDRLLARYVTNEVYAFSPFFRARLDACGLGRRGVGRQEDLARLPVLALSEADPGAIVLRPDPEAVVQYGRRRWALEMRWAALTGATEKVKRASIDPDYKAVRWTVSGALSMGLAVPDLNRLGDLGRRTLELAGLRTNDVILGIGARPDEIGMWQLAMGARDGGVASLFLPAGAAPDAVARSHPTTLTGAGVEVTELLRELAIAGLRLPELRTVIATGPPPDAAAREEITALAAEALANGQRGASPAADPVVVWAWSPPGVRALWVECRGGNAFHTWPAAEVVQVAGQEGARSAAGGDLVWSAVGWRGSVLLRLDTGAEGVVHLDMCPTCGRTTPRVQVGSFR